MAAVNRPPLSMIAHSGNARRSLLSSLLSISVVTTALGLIYSSHLCREYYAELQRIETSRWQLEEEYSRLILEHGTLASPHRVQELAAGDLGMVAPTADQRRVVMP